MPTSMPAATRLDRDRYMQARLAQSAGLSDDALARIRRQQDKHAISFSDAAVQLGYLSADDLAEPSSLVHVAQSKEKQARPVEQLDRVSDLTDPRGEQIRSLRTELLLRHEANGEANCVVVLSPGEGEGRSQLAAELAISFARLRQPTLLVDADFRFPEQHKLFGIENDEGLSTAITEGSDPLLHPVAGLPDLLVLTAGSPPVDPLERLSGRAFEDLVNGWRQRYAFVVFDTPPISAYADGLVTAAIVGRVLVLSRAQHTRYRDTRSMLRRLSSTRARTLGAVINHF